MCFISNFFNICVLSQCIVYWIHFQNTHTFTCQNILLHTHFCLFLKLSKTFSVSLEVVSATFLLVLFVCLKAGTCETRKNVFNFTSKALFVLEIIKFYIFRYSNVMMSSNALAWNTKLILLNNLGSKVILVMKFDQFM